MASVLAKEAACPGAGRELLILRALAPAFEVKEAGLGDMLNNAGTAIGNAATGAGEWMSKTWDKTNPAVLGGLAGGALMGGAGYMTADRLPEEGDDEFNARRRRFALTAGLGGAAVGAVVPRIANVTGLDKKVQGGARSVGNYLEKNLGSPETKARIADEENQVAKEQALADEKTKSDVSWKTRGASTTAGAAAGAGVSLIGVKGSTDRRKADFAAEGPRLKSNQADAIAAQAPGSEVGNATRSALGVDPILARGDSLEEGVAEARARVDAARQNLPGHVGPHQDLAIARPAFEAAQATLARAQAAAAAAPRNDPVSKANLSTAQTTYDLAKHHLDLSVAGTQLGSRQGTLNTQMPVIGKVRAIERYMQNVGNPLPAGLTSAETAHLSDVQRLRAEATTHGKKYEEWRNASKPTALGTVGRRMAIGGPIGAGLGYVAPSFFDWLGTKTPDAKLEVGDRTFSTTTKKP